MKIGYARVSTSDQTLDPQIDELKAAGCEKFFSDVISGSKSERVGLNQCLEFIRQGDVLVVVKLDRLGRSLKHLIETIELLKEMGVGFQSLKDGIDTTTPAGRLLFHLIGAIAEFERELIRERTNAGLKAARARGRKGGRPKKLSEKQIEAGCMLAKTTDWTVDQICEHLGISRATYYRWVEPKTGGREVTGEPSR